MSIAVVCPKCSAKLNAPDSAAGKRVKCPKCQNAMLVPDALPAEPEFEVVDEAQQPASKPRVKAAVELDDDDDRPRKKRRDDNDDGDEEVDRPKKKKKRQRDDDDDKRGVTMTRNIVMGVVLVILLGVVAFVFYDRFKKKDEDKAASNDDAKTANPRVVGPAGPGLPTITPNAGGAGGGNPGGGNPGGGNPVGKKPIGTPGQPITFTSPAGFKVTFPGPYVSEDLPPAFRQKLGLPLTVNISEDRTTRQTFVAASTAFEASATAADKKSIYDKVIKFLLDEAQKGAVPSRRTITIGGRSWEEITVKDKDEKEGGGIMRVLQTDSHIYVLVAAHDKTAPPADMVKKFFDSFELTK